MPRGLSAGDARRIVLTIMAVDTNTARTFRDVAHSIEGSMGDIEAKVTSASKVVSKELSNTADAATRASAGIKTALGAASGSMNDLANNVAVNAARIEANLADVQRSFEKTAVVAMASGGAGTVGGGGGGRGGFGPWWMRRLFFGGGAAFTLFHLMNPLAAEIASITTAIGSLVLAGSALVGVAAGIAVVTVQANRLGEALGFQTTNLDKYISAVQRTFLQAGQTIEKSLTGPAHQGLAMLSGAVILLTNQFAPMFSRIISNLAKGAGSLLPTLVGIIQRWVPIIGNVFSRVGAGLVHMFTAFQPGAIAFVQGLVHVFRVFSQTVAQLIAPISKSIVPFLHTFFNIVGQLIQVWAPLSAAFEKASVGILKLVNAIGRGLVPIAQAAVPVISVFASAVGGLAGGLAKIAAPIVTFVGGPILAFIVMMKTAGIIVSLLATGLGKLSLAFSALANAALDVGLVKIGTGLAGMAEGTASAGSGLLAMAGSVGIAIGAVAALGFGIGLLIHHFNQVRQAAADLKIQTTIVPKLTTGAMTPGQLANMLGPTTISIPSRITAGRIAVPGVSTVDIRNNLLRMESDKQLASLITGTLVPAWDMLTAKQKDNVRFAASQRHLTDLLNTSLSQQQANLQLNAQMLDAYNKALIHPTVNMGKLQGMLKGFVTATGSSMAQFMASAQAAAEGTSQQIISWIQQQDQAWFQLRDSMATALGAGGAYLQQFANKAHVNFGKVMTNMTKVHSQQQQFVSDINTIMKNVPKNTQVAVQQLATMGLSGVGLANSIAGSTKKQQRSWAQLATTIQNTATSSADALTTKLYGSIHQLNILLGGLLLSFGKQLPAAVMQALRALGLLKGAIDNLHSKNIVIGVNVKLLGVPNFLQNYLGGTVTTGPGGHKPLYKAQHGFYGMVNQRAIMEVAEAGPEMVAVIPQKDVHKRASILSKMGWLGPGTGELAQTALIHLRFVLDQTSVDLSRGIHGNLLKFVNIAVNELSKGLDKFGKAYADIRTRLERNFQKQGTDITQEFEKKRSQITHEFEKRRTDITRHYEALRQAAKTAAAKSAITQQEDAAKQELTKQEDAAKRALMKQENAKKYLLRLEEDAAKKQAQAFIGGLQTRGDALLKHIQNVQKQMQGLHDNIIQGFQQANLVSAFGTQPGVDPSQIGIFYKQSIADARRFAHLLKRLAAAGLNRQMLGQIAALGPGGIPLAEAILSAGVQNVNAWQGTLNRIAGGTANAVVSTVFGPMVKRARKELEDFTEAVADATEKIKKATDKSDKNKPKQASDVHVHFHDTAPDNASIIRDLSWWFRHHATK